MRISEMLSLRNLLRLLLLQLFLSAAHSVVAQETGQYETNITDGFSQPALQDEVVVQNIQLLQSELTNCGYAYDCLDLEVFFGLIGVLHSRELYQDSAILHTNLIEISRQKFGRNHKNNIPILVLSLENLVSMPEILASEHDHLESFFKDTIRLAAITGEYDGLSSIARIYDYEISSAIFSHQHPYFGNESRIVYAIQSAAEQAIEVSLETKRLHFSTNPLGYHDQLLDVAQLYRGRVFGYLSSSSSFFDSRKLEESSRTAIGFLFEALRLERDFLGERHNEIAEKYSMIANFYRGGFNSFDPNAVQIFKSLYELAPYEERTWFSKKTVESSTVLFREFDYYLKFGELKRASKALSKLLGEDPDYFVGDPETIAELWIEAVDSQKVEEKVYLFTVLRALLSELNDKDRSDVENLVADWTDYRETQADYSIDAFLQSETGFEGRRPRDKNNFKPALNSPESLFEEIPLGIAGGEPVGSLFEPEVDADRAACLDLSKIVENLLLFPNGALELSNYRDSKPPSTGLIDCFNSTDRERMLRTLVKFKENTDDLALKVGLIADYSNLATEISQYSWPEFSSARKFSFHYATGVDYPRLSEALHYLEKAIIRSDHIFGEKSESSAKLLSFRHDLYAANSDWINYASSLEDELERLSDYSDVEETRSRLLDHLLNNEDFIKAKKLLEDGSSFQDELRYLSETGQWGAYVKTLKSRKEGFDGPVHELENINDQILWGLLANKRYDQANSLLNDQLRRIDEYAKKGILTELDPETFVGLFSETPKAYERRRRIELNLVKAGIFIDQGNHFEAIETIEEIEEIQEAIEVDESEYGLFSPEFVHELSLFSMELELGRFGNARMHLNRFREIGGEDLFDISISYLDGLLNLAQENWQSAHEVLSEYRPERAGYLDSAQEMDVFSDGAEEMHFRLTRLDIPYPSRRAFFDRRLILTAELLKESPAFEVVGADKIAETLQDLQVLTNNTLAAQAIERMAFRASSGDARLKELTRLRQNLIASKRILNARRNSTTESLILKSKAEANEDLDERIAEIDIKLLEVNALTRAEYPGEYLQSSGRVYNLAEIQELLGDDESLIVFYETEPFLNLPKRNFMWLVGKSSIDIISLNFDKISLEDAVLILRCGIDRVYWDTHLSACVSALDISFADVPLEGDSLPFDQHASYYLYSKIFGGIAPEKLKSSIAIVPFGPLSEIPFNLLISEPPLDEIKIGQNFADYSWFHRKYSHSVYPSLAAFVSLRSITNGNFGQGSYVGFGNPQLDGTNRDSICANSARKYTSCDVVLSEYVSCGSVARSSVGAFRNSAFSVDTHQLLSLPPLPETAFEICNVSDALGGEGNNVFLGSDATEGKVKSLSQEGRLKEYSVVHFATHATTSGEIQAFDEPGIIFTPPNSPSEFDDGFLSATEVAGLDLNAEWIILSACNTAAGNGESTEALSGLATSFFYAGAKSILVSHWFVDSEAAKELVTMTFGSLQKNASKNPAKSLSAAMDSLLQSQSYLSHPEAWAPFVFVGDATH